jgi:ABC-type hemin transport system ATPase subunit
VRALVSFVDRLICLAGGRVVGDGSPTAVLADPAVKEVFLGTEATADVLVDAIDEAARSDRRRKAER